jgi:hypothetical protein
MPAAGRQTTLASRRASLGQVAELPVQVSAGSQSPFESRQTVLAGLNLQIPTLPARVHDWQSPVQALSQQTPPEHWPLWQTLPSAHMVPAVSLGTHLPDWQ